MAPPWFKSPKGKIIHTRELVSTWCCRSDHAHWLVRVFWDSLMTTSSLSWTPNMESAVTRWSQVDTKPYPKRAESCRPSSSWKDAVVLLTENGWPRILLSPAWDFSFWLMAPGSVVSSYALLDHSSKPKQFILDDFTFGGARRMEAGSFAQMAKDICQTGFINCQDSLYLFINRPDKMGGYCFTPALGDFGHCRPWALMPGVLALSVVHCPPPVVRARRCKSTGFWPIVDRRTWKNRLSTLLKMLRW